LDKLKHVLLFAAAASTFAAERVEILRDNYGVPHIYATTVVGAAYGSGYAQAADRGEQLLANLGSAARAVAPSPLSERTRAVVAAYCAGANAYFGTARVEPSMVEGFSRSAFSSISESADILIAPSRSSEKAVIAILSPLAEWSERSRLYEIEIETAEGFSFAGLSPVGAPLPLIGHSDAIAIGTHGGGSAGEKALDEIWALTTARNLEEVKRALEMGQFPGQKFLVGTAAGDIYDSGDGTLNPSDGILLAGGGVPQAVAMTRTLISRANSFSVESAVSLAFATDVYKAETWQARIAKLAPGSEFARILTGWSRRADVDSRPALAFYLFKMALDQDASALEPRANLSDQRIRAALRKAQDRFEIEFPVNATYGSVFRFMRDGERRSWPVGGGTAVEAGMATPRAIAFDHRGGLLIGHGGQAGVLVAALSKPAKSVMAVPFGESDSPDSPHFEDQARQLFSHGYTMTTWFGDRKSLEKRSKDRKELIVP
jgi:acyl-homoserine lactone acylase PvdQ